MSAPRYCPLCDGHRQEAICPKHQVPTVPSGAAAPPRAQIEAGTVLAGRYQVHTVLGKGGMGAVLSAFDRLERREVVLKVLRGGRIRNRAVLRRFYREGRSSCDLRHPNVVQVFELGFDSATAAPFLVMERLHGETLERVLDRDGRFGEARSARIVGQVARALEAAHSHGILHRDLKPKNVMLNNVRSGGSAAQVDRIKVLDFGLAKVLEPDHQAPPLTAPGRTVGTPPYMSPEQITQSPQDGRSDLYGLGCLLHHLLTGRPPYLAPRATDVMRMHLRYPIPPLPDRLSDGRAPSRELVQLHASLLAKRAADRPWPGEVAPRFEALALDLSETKPTFLPWLISKRSAQGAEGDWSPVGPALPGRVPVVDAEQVTSALESLDAPTVQLRGSGPPSASSSTSSAAFDGTPKKRRVGDEFASTILAMQGQSSRFARNLWYLFGFFALLGAVSLGVLWSVVAQ